MFFIGIILIFLLIIFIGIAIALYVLGSLGIMDLAKKNNFPRPWIAFIPYANIYLIGKLGYDLYLPKSKKKPYLIWITFGLSLGSILVSSLGNIENLIFKNSIASISSGTLSYLISIAVSVLVAIALYNVMKKEIKEKATLIAILSGFFGFNLGGTIIFFMRKKITGKARIADTETNELEDDDDLNDKEEKTKSKDSKVHYCANCGQKLEKDMKFCSKCGTPVE